MSGVSSPSPDCVGTLCLISRVQLCNPMDCNPPGSSVLGILQARILEWVAMPSSKGSSRPRDHTGVSCGSCLAGGFFTTEPSESPKRSLTWALSDNPRITSPPKNP